MRQREGGAVARAPDGSTAPCHTCLGRLELEARFGAWGPARQLLYEVPYVGVVGTLGRRDDDRGRWLRKSSTRVQARCLSMTSRAFSHGRSAAAASSSGRSHDDLAGRQTCTPVTPSSHDSFNSPTYDAAVALLHPCLINLSGPRATSSPLRLTSIAPYLPTRCALRLMQGSGESVAD